MAIEIVKEKYLRAVNAVRLGSDKSGNIVVGGESAFTLMSGEGGIPNPPLVALEIYDCQPRDWPDHLKEVYRDVISDPVEWARKCVSVFGAKALCVRVMSAHPDYGSADIDEALARLANMRRAAKVPFIIIGSGDDETDRVLMPKVAKEFQGENYLLGVATQSNYKELAASCASFGHSIIAQSPIDVNIAKQMSILLSDAGMDSARIVMDPTAASLGYGMEYVYSIMERARIASFGGDKMLSGPFILFVGQETWKTKESKDAGVLQGINWEIATATAFFQAGADILVMLHPDAAMAFSKFSCTLFNGGK